MLFKPVSTDGLENLEVWPGYTALLLKLDGELLPSASLSRPACWSLDGIQSGLATWQ